MYFFVNQNAVIIQRQVCYVYTSSFVTPLRCVIIFVCDETMRPVYAAPTSSHSGCSAGAASPRSPKRPIPMTHAMRPHADDAIVMAIVPWCTKRLCRNPPSRGRLRAERRSAATPPVHHAPTLLPPSRASALPTLAANIKLGKNNKARTCIHSC